MLNQASVNTIPVNGYLAAALPPVVNPVIYYWEDSYIWPIDTVQLSLEGICIGIDTVTPRQRVDCLATRASVVCCK